MGEVSLRRVEQRAEQRHPQHRLLGRHRVLELDDRGVAETQPSELLAAGEAPPDRLVQALRGEHVRGLAALALARGEAAVGAVAARQRRRELVEPVEPRDLLDHVDLPGDVAAPERGRLHVEAVRRVGRGELERFEDLLAAFARDRRAEQPRDALVPQPDRHRRRPVAADVDRPRPERGAAHLDHQLGRYGLRLDRLLGLELLLEAQRRLALEPERPRGVVDVGAVPRRGLHQHARGRVGHLRAGAAHHAGDRGRSVGVVDHEHLRVERAGLAVERLDLLAFVRAADRERLAGDLVEVERVQRLAGQQHHVVGDVDDVRDRALAGGHQPRLQPRGARPELHVLEQAGGEPRAEVGVLDLDRDALDRAGRARVLVPRRRVERRAGGGVGLARDPVDGQAVGPVGGDLELEHVGREREHVFQRRAGLEMVLSRAR